MNISERVLKKFSEMSLEIANTENYDRSTGGEIIQTKVDNSYVFERQAEFFKNDKRTTYLLRVVTSLDLDEISYWEWVSINANV